MGHMLERIKSEENGSNYAADEHLTHLVLLLMHSRTAKVELVCERPGSIPGGDQLHTV